MTEDVIIVDSGIPGELDEHVIDDDGAEDEDDEESVDDLLVTQLPVEIAFVIPCVCDTLLLLPASQVKKVLETITLIRNLVNFIFTLLFECAIF